MGLEVAALALGAVGTGISAVGAMTNANAQASAAEYSAQVAANNARIANQNAEYAAQAGSEKETEASLKSREAVARATTGAAANGVDVGSGSAADVIKSTRQVGTLNTETVANNAALQVYGFRSQATGYEAQSQLDMTQAANARTAGGFAAFGDLLSGFSSVGSKWSQYQLLSGGGDGGGSSSSFSGLAIG